METFDNFVHLPVYLLLPILAFVVFGQNVALTWMSRSRVSGDVEYHRWAAYAYNGAWFVSQVLIMGTLFRMLTQGDPLKIVLTGIVYMIASTEGSCAAMHSLIKYEKGLRRVGSYPAT